ncbi:MAG UNVERIFIED_CONTAM: hypothetical protein LVR18_27695 [Planctomycetaceae bacterium]
MTNTCSPTTMGEDRPIPELVFSRQFPSQRSIPAARVFKADPVTSRTSPCGPVFGSQWTRADGSGEQEQQRGTNVEHDSDRQ